MMWRSSQQTSSRSRRSRRAGQVLVHLLSAVLLGGCATSTPPIFPRPFAFHWDTFAYPNELIWEYHLDPASGQMTHRRRQPPPTYSHHCFVVARSARQFFLHARFAPELPPVEDPACRKLIRRIVSRSPRRPSAESEKIVIPGYTNLFQFSEAREALLKSACGGAWQSYFQRGSWRMIFPLTRRHQDRMASQLMATLDQQDPPVIHLVRFPSLSINHAMVLFGYRHVGTTVHFEAYDPNNPAAPAELIYDPAERRFTLPRNSYFAGGRVDIYQVYHAWNY